MAATDYHSLADVNAGSFEWRVKVRIIRAWRGISSKGEAFKGLNVLLLDDTNCKMHAFVPGNIIEQHAEKFLKRNICSLANFVVKDFRPDDKFRFVNSDRQIMLTNYTKVVQIDSHDNLIPDNMFDFYDLAALHQIANINVSLTDVIGIISRDYPLSDLVNKFGQPQKQVKFTIVDTSASVNVTFWDSIAEEFVLDLEDVTDYPTVVIIASAKVTSWQESRQSSPQIEIGNVTLTRFYLNARHHAVAHLRSKKPSLSKYKFPSHIKEQMRMLNTEEIKNLPMEYAEIYNVTYLTVRELFLQKEISTQVLIKLVIPSNNWFDYICTSCYQILNYTGAPFRCFRCAERNVEEPHKKWCVTVVCEEEKGQIDIVLMDREVRTLIGFTVDEVTDKDNAVVNFPPILKSIENKFYTIRLQVNTLNVQKQLSLFYATGIYCNSLDNINVGQSLHTPGPFLQESLTLDSPHTFHLDESPEQSRQARGVHRKGKGKLKRDQLRSKK